MVKAKMAGCAVAFVAASLFFGITENPDPPRLAVVYAFAIFASCLWIYNAMRGGPVRVSYPSLIGIAAVAYAALTLLWSPDPRQGALDLANASAYLVVFMTVSSMPRRHLSALLPAVVTVAAIGALALIYLWPKAHGGFGNENFASEFLILSLPFMCAVGGLRKHDIAGVFLVAPAVLIYLFAFNGSDEKLYVLLGIGLLCVYLLARSGRYLTASILVALPVFALVALDLSPSENLIHSISSRVEMTTVSAFMWLASPWSAFFGNGIGGFNFTYPAFQESYLSIFPNMKTIFVDYAKYAGAAHNEYMQVLVEFGLIGFALVAALAFFTIRNATRRGVDILDVAALWVLGLAGWLSLVAFPFQNAPTGVVLAVSGGLLASKAPMAQISLNMPLRGAMALAGLALCALVGMAGFNTVYANMLFTNFHLYHKTDKLTAFAYNLAAYQAFTWPNKIRRQLSLSLGTLLANEHKRMKLEPAAADQIYKISQTSGGRTFAIESARLEYLYNSGRWKTEQKEVADKRTWMRKNAVRFAAFWVLEGHLAYVMGDNFAAEKAVMRGLAIYPINPIHSRQLMRLASRLGANK